MEKNDNRNKMDKLTKLMLDTDKAMEMTREKQLLIDNMRKELMEETRPMMVEQRKEELAGKEKEKEEFDEMTKNALKRAKKQIQTMREESEKEYQEKLIGTIEKKKEIEKKLKSIEQRGLTDEKLAMAKTSADKALTKANEEMKTYQDKHFSKRAKLDEFEADIDKYALELGLEIESEKVDEQKPIEDKSLEEQEKGKKQEESIVEEQEEQVVEEQETVGAAMGEASENIPEVEGDLSVGDELPKVAFVEVKDNKYIVAYETKENGVYSIDKKECEKLGFFKGLFEKAKLVINRKEYGIDFMSAMRADVNIFRNLNDKDKETYLNYISGERANCFDIAYDNPKNRYAKALAKGQERLALKEAEALEQYGPELEPELDEDIIHDLQQSKYDLMFGSGFDQHDNPPVVNDKAENEDARKTVRDILYGDIDKDEK